jgi:hypothetical protein
MKTIKLIAAVLTLTVVVLVNNASAGAPFNNLEGVGGVAFNPLAYLADSSGENSHLKVGDTDVLGKARFGAWYVSLGDVKVDWTAIGVADTLFKRLEVSYGYETVNPEHSVAIHKNNLGAKLLLLPENSFDTAFLPSIAVGAIFKNSSNVADGVDDSGQDVYLVATKLITQLPRPVLLSGGVLSTNSRVTGVFGYDEDRKTTLFGNIDIILPAGLIAGFEYKQGAEYDDWKDASYWNAHLAWTPTAALTLIAAHVDAGDYKSTTTVGLGGGLVLSAQYAF